MYLTSIVFLLPRVPSSEYSSSYSSYLAHAQTTEHSVAVNASSFEQASSGSPTSRMCCTSCSHSGEVRLTSSGSQYQQRYSQSEAVHSDATSLAVPRTWVLSPHDTNKVDMLCYSPPKIQDLLKNLTSHTKCLSSQTDPLF